MTRGTRASLGSWALFALSAVAAACGDDGPKRVGSPCVQGDVCGTRPGNACIVDWPDGYCTEFPCEVGSCASGAVCVSGIQFSNVPQSNFCMAACSSDSDCRAGYHCANVSGGDRFCTFTSL